MRIHSLLLVFVLLAASCSEDISSPLPTCFPKRPTSKPLDSIQQKALDQSKLRVASRCNRQDTQCGFGVRTQSGGEVDVKVEFATPDRKSGHCIHVIGGWQIDVYDKDGKFLRIIPGL